MPEGDTVWLTARRLDQALGRCVLTVSDLRVPQLATTELAGMTVTEVRRARQAHPDPARLRLHAAQPPAHGRFVVPDSRRDIGGNAYSEIDPETGIEVHRYGAHLFHTSNKRVWDYANQFTEFSPYVHHVYTTYMGEVFPMPINLGTINQFQRAAYTPTRHAPGSSSRRRCSRVSRPTSRRRRSR